MFNEQANKEYIETQFKVREEIKKLLSNLDDHNQAANIHWGHVGDVKHILSQLQELNGEEDE
jgi:hypothetical protein